jgi:ribonuclease P protein component
VIRGIRRRATFAALRHEGRKVRRRGLAVVYLPAPTDTTEVAFAISRRTATAVRRNRCRRRLRAALDEVQRAGRLPHGAYLISVAPEAVEAPQAHLRTILDEVLTELSVRSR